MKLRQALNLVGVRQKPRSYKYEVRSQRLRGAAIEYAQWLHPKAYDCRVKDSELARLQEILAPGDVAIDIGAHMGDSTLPMALAVGKQGTVIAFEPNAYVFPVLEANSQLNPTLTNIHPFRHAITEEDREVKFSYGDPGFMNGGSIARTRRFRWGNTYIQNVQGVRLDTFLAQNYPELAPQIRYVKIDAEGYDYFVMKSMEELIQTARPYIQAEVMRGTPREYRDGMFHLLAQHGYRIQRHLNGINEPGWLTQQDMYFADNFDIFCSPQLAN